MKKDKELIRSIEDLLVEKPQIAESLEEILRTDDQNETWHFEDISVGTGHFGEIVSKGIVTTDSDGYTLTNRETLEYVLENKTWLRENSDRDTDPTTGRNSILKSIVNRFDSPVLVLLLLLLVSGTSLRVYNLGVAPFWIDESISYSAAMGFLEHGELVLQGSGNVYDRAPLHTLFIALSIGVFGAGEFATRMPSVLSGIGTIVVIYYIGRRSESEFVGILAAGLYSFAFFEIAWARQARMYALFQFLFILTVLVYFLALGTHNKNHKTLYFLLGVLLIGGLSQIHSGWLFIFPVLLFGIAFNVTTDRVSLEITRWGLFVSTFLYIFIVVISQHPVFPGSVFNIVGIDASNVQYLSEVPLFFISHYPITTIFVLLGTVTSLLTKSTPRAIVLVGFWLGLFVTTYFALAIHPFFWPRYLLFMTPFFFLIAAYGTADCIQFIQGSNYSVHISRLVENVGSLDSLRTRPLLIILVLLIPILLFPGYGVGATGLSTIHEPQPDYRTAVEQMESAGYQEGDIVVSTRPNLLNVYGVTVDYVASPHGGGDTDYYTGATTVDSSNEMVDIIRNNDDGWIVINKYRTTPGQQFIEENTELVTVIDPYSPFNRTQYQLETAPDEGEELVYVYKWD